MITTLELTQLQEEANQCIIDCAKDINSLTQSKSITASEYERKEAELRRLKRALKKAKEDLCLYKAIGLYLSSGVEMEGIKQQRNELLIKLAINEDRLKYDEYGELRRKGPLNRLSVSYDEKLLIAKHDAKYGTKKLKKQLKALNFILK